MSRRAITPLLTLSVLFIAGCYYGPRRPLFGGAADGAQLGAETQIPPLPPRRLEPTDADELLDRLRRADGDGKRQQIVRELAGAGPDAVSHVELALTEERVLVDVLEEILRQLDAEAKETKGRVPAAWVEEKYRLALDRSLAGDGYGAIQLVDAILAIESETDMRGKLRRLRRSCKERLLRQTVFTADLKTSAATLLPSKPLVVEVRLENLSKEILELRLAEDRRLGTVDVDYEVVSQDGNRTRTRTQVPVKATRDLLRLEPGQATTLTVKIPQPHADLPGGALGRYHLGGRLRAQTMMVGEGSYRMFVPLSGADVLVLSRKDASLAKYPFRAFEKAVEKASTGTVVARREPARRAFVASLIMVHRRPDEALPLIVAALEQARGPLSKALCSALARATREPLNFTRQEWLIWWQGRRSRPIKSSSPAEESEGSDQ